MATATTYSKTDRDDAGRGAVDTMADRAAELANKAGHHVDRALDTAEGVARQVADQGREASERVAEVAGNVKSAVDKSVKDQPMATLAVAAGLGFVIGALWKS
jgi:ElaB/YqjD/DUF883 family membrane-anchored ribosome-binding protein